MIDVRKSLGRTRILRGVSFGVPRGSITALIGPSGAGKTTCLRHIVGLMAPDRGDVLVDGSSIYSMAAGELASTRRNMSVMFQDGALFGSRNVFDNVAFALRQLGGLSEPQIGARAHERLRQVGLDGCDDLLPDQLSTGMRKRLALARALARDAEIFVLDDLDTGLDGVRLDALCRLIREFQERAGATYLVTTHDMDVVRQLADRVVVLWNGRVLEVGTAEEIRHSCSESVRQLVAGDPVGPLGLHSEEPGIPHPERLHEQRYGMRSSSYFGPVILAMIGMVLLVAYLAQAGIYH